LFVVKEFQPIVSSKQLIVLFPLTSLYNVVKFAYSWLNLFPLNHVFGHIEKEVYMCFGCLNSFKNDALL